MSGRHYYGFRTHDLAVRFVSMHLRAYSDVRSKRLRAKNADGVDGHVYIFKYRMGGTTRYGFEIGA